MPALRGGVVELRGFCATPDGDGAYNAGKEIFEEKLRGKFEVKK